MFLSIYANPGIARTLNSPEQPFATQMVQNEKVKAHLILTVVCVAQIPMFNFVYGLEKVNFKPCFSC